MNEIDIKKIIMKVSGLSDDPGGLGDDVALSDLGFNNLMCADLTNRLNKYIKEKGCNQKISHGDITPDTTTGEVVEMVKDKLKLCGL